MSPASIHRVLFTGCPCAMTSFRFFVGIDVSKHTLDLCLIEDLSMKPKHLRVGNADAGFAQLMEWLAEHEALPSATVCCMENTGLYDDRLLEALTLCGYACSVEKTTVLKQVGPTHHRKDDAFDAKLLAEYAYRYQDKLCLWSACEPIIEEIRMLYRERRRLVTQRGAAKQLFGERAYRTAQTDLAEELWEEQIAFLTRQIGRIEARIDELLQKDDDIHHRYQLLRSMAGFGKVLALLWLVTFYGETRLNPRRIASRYGVAPHGEVSGTSHQVKAHSTGHGNAEMRKVLRMSACSVAEHYEKFRRYKERKLAEGKPSKLVTNNIINKLIRIVCTLWNQNVFYEKDHVSRFARNSA